MVFQDELNTNPYCSRVTDQVMGHHIDRAGACRQIAGKAESNLNEFRVWYQPDIFRGNFMSLIGTIDEVYFHQ